MSGPAVSPVDIFLGLLSNRMLGLKSGSDLDFFLGDSQPPTKEILLRHMFRNKKKKKKQISICHGSTLLSLDSIFSLLQTSPISI